MLPNIWGFERPSQDGYFKEFSSAYTKIYARDLITVRAGEDIL